MTPREPDRFGKLETYQLLRHVVPEARKEVLDWLAAALRQAADEALERAAQRIEWLGHPRASINAAAIRALASPAAAPAWTPPRDAMTGMTAAEEMRAAGIDVLHGVKPAAAPAAETGKGHCWSDPQWCAEHGQPFRICSEQGYAPPSAPVAPAAEEPLGFCDWPGFKDHPHKKQEDHGRSDAEGNPLGCKNWRPVPPSASAAPEKKPFACGADMESDGHLYRCDRGAGHTGSHGERDYAEWTDAEHHDGEPVAPSLLPRVLAALESRPDGYVLHCLVLELRRYIAGVEAGHAEAPDTERDRNRHNAMLVEAWREEFGTLCKVLFPGNDGPIGWKHVQAKVAALAKTKEPPR